MDDFLTPVKTTPLTESTENGLSLSKETKLTTNKPITSAEDIIDVLRSQPDGQQLQDVLSYINHGGARNFLQITVPGPVSSQLINALVTIIIPDFWESLGKQKSQRLIKQDIITCLRNTSGIGAIVARLKALVLESKQKKGRGERKSVVQHISNLLEVLELVLHDGNTTYEIWKSIYFHIASPLQRTLIWKEFVSLVASGKVLTASAQAEDVLKESKEVPSVNRAWIATGSDTSKWLGRNIVLMLGSKDADDDTYQTDLSLLLRKSMTLGYLDSLVGEIICSTVLTQGKSVVALSKLVSKLLLHEQKKFIVSVLSVISGQFLKFSNSNVNEKEGETPKDISGSAALLAGLLSDNERLLEIVVTWTTSATTAGLNSSVRMLRVAFAVLSDNEDSLQQILEKNLDIFGDQLFIKHTPILQQEALAQRLLLACGYVHRKQPIALLMIARSSTHGSGMTNRIAASSPRARFLGMVVGVAISELVDKPESRMKFDFDESEKTEVEYLTDLTRIKDNIGTIEDLKMDEREPQKRSKQILTTQKANLESVKSNAKSSSKITEIKVPRVVEILDDSEDDDLVPYSKPDSDPEDDTEDATLVQRNKPIAPVYVRDLIAGLKDSENYDRHILALQTSTSLIRRKSNFGKEVIDHIHDLASTLVGLQDNFDIEKFHEMRQQAMVATLLAQPAEMGQWFAKAFFEGDYSLSQRVTLLTTMGLGARELAGYSSDDTNTPAVQSFPSKKLPERLHKIYATEISPVESISKRLQRSVMEPLALDAADRLSGPSVLKVRTFSSRMEVEKKRKKVIPNELAKIVSQSFFFPLTGRWWTHLQAYGNQSLYFSPIVLPVYLKTLAIILHASGPSTHSLPQMTSELWDLLLSIRSNADEPAILEAWLFAVLMSLEVNEDKQRLAQDHAKALLEIQGWMKLVFDRLGRGDEDERIRSLAAGVLVRCGEVIEKYQRLLLGDLLDY
ncbi:hypothetical protein M501DRAFT_996622 [Patellaria atrata CBS 101060]|uniref:Telomere length regulation protein conserved domain-containing protein n=1 Tax=Patellaria atrata CBS 101060 TaxID=1346257 RepID=A0A9P4VNN4_9PEZI|nr:hypothetical protein M501DRAFT_996622 [Patellaria atrata CBS 101060]